jgi:hypothetical protein
MRATRTLIATACALIAAVGLAGCGESPQELAQKPRGYQGKPDSNPWDNDPGSSLYTTSKWNKGDKASWEDALKQRALAQNEYNRVQ